MRDRRGLLIGLGLGARVLRDGLDAAPPPLDGRLRPGVLRPGGLAALPRPHPQLAARSEHLLRPPLAGAARLRRALQGGGHPGVAHRRPVPGAGPDGPPHAGARSRPRGSGAVGDRVRGPEPDAPRGGVLRLPSRRAGHSLDRSLRPGLAARRHPAGRHRRHPRGAGAGRPRRRPPRGRDHQPASRSAPVPGHRAPRRGGRCRGAGAHGEPRHLGRLLRSSRERTARCHHPPVAHHRRGRRPVRWVPCCWAGCWP